MYKLLYKLHPPILGVHKSKMPHHILYFMYENIYQNRHHFIMLLSYVCLKLERERVKNKMASFPNLLTSTQLHPIHFHSVELNTWLSPFHTSPVHLAIACGTLLQRGWSRSRTLSVSFAAGATSPLDGAGQVKVNLIKKIIRFNI